MLILTIRTDNPTAEIGLYDNSVQKLYFTWQAHRQLAETLHQTIKDQLHQTGYGWPDLAGVAVYEGPGSFTGLRIGISVANAIAYSLGIPVSGATGDDWQSTAISSMANGDMRQSVMPTYGSPVHITTPRK